MSAKIMLRRVGSSVIKNLPTILTWTGAGGVIITTVTAIKATTKANLIVDELRHEHSEKFEAGEVSTEQPATIEIVKAVGPTYIPTIIVGGMTIACIIGAAKVSARRNAVLSGLYAASEFALKEYRNKVIERVGEKEERAVREEIAHDKLVANPITHNNQVILTGKGNHLCYDSLSGRYFRSDIETIRKLQNDINREIISQMWYSLNRVYSELMLDRIELGDDIGFDVDHMLDFYFTTDISNEGEPCLVLNYDKKPGPRTYGY